MSGGRSGGEYHTASNPAGRHPMLIRKSPQCILKHGDQQDVGVKREQFRFP